MSKASTAPVAEICLYGTRQTGAGYIVSIRTAVWPVRLTEKPAGPTALALATAKRDHVLTMLQKADTRLKRAATIQRAWARKLRDAERRLAAAYQKEPLHTDGGLDLAPAAVPRSVDLAAFPWTNRDLQAAPWSEAEDLAAAGGERAESTETGAERPRTK